MIPIENIVAQHASEAAHLWMQWQDAVLAPHYVPWELARHRDRVEANIDGLRIAGDPGWNIVYQQLEDKSEPGEVFVAAFLAYESGKQDRIDKVLALAAPVYTLHSAVVSALTWLPASQATRYLPALLNGVTPGLRRIGLSAASALHSNPGLALEKGLNDLDLSLRSRALKVVGEMGYQVWANQLRKELRSPDLGCRFTAAWSLARMSSDAAALAELHTIALAESTYRIPALNILVRRLEPGAVRKLIGMLSKIPGAERLVLFTMGVWGDPVDVPYLLEKMTVTPHARIAAESFSFITGLNLTDSNFDASTPADHEAVPNEDPLDDRVELDPDDNLPWPLVDKVQDWWNKNRSRFQPGTRYLVGELLNEARCKQILDEGFQRQRAYAAFELALKNPGQPFFDITGRTK